MADLHGPHLRYAKYDGRKMASEFEAFRLAVNYDLYDLLTWAADLNAAIEALSTMLRSAGVSDALIQKVIQEAKRP